MIYTQKVRIYYNCIDYCIVMICIYCIIIHSLLIDTSSYYLISMFISILTIICFYRYIVSIYIAICYSDYNSYNIVTM